MADKDVLNRVIAVTARVLGLDPYGEPPYLVMELVKGPALRQVLTENHGGLPIPQAQVILRGLLRGVSAAHEAGIIHRDLKPGNILLHLDGRTLDSLTVDDVKVGDFGLGFTNADTARSVILQSGSIERDALSGQIAGTLAYMAPELRDSGQSATPRSDLYAVGVILYEMLTGERPAGTELPSTLRPEVPTALDDVFKKLYARLDRRYESAAAVLEDLERRPATPSATDPPPPPPGPAPRAREMGICRQCHQPVASDDQFCTQCGTQLVEVVPRCGACGGYPGPDDRFCIFCGTALAAGG